MLNGHFNAILKSPKSNNWQHTLPCTANQCLGDSWSTSRYKSMDSRDESSGTQFPDMIPTTLIIIH
jgi:hypothetical protein